MTLRQRLLSLIALLVVGFGLAVGFLHTAETREQDELRESLRQDQTAITDRLIDLSGKPLQQFVDDYSWWDDMVDFVQAPDPTWAEVNLLEMTDFFDVDVIWVLGLDGVTRFQVSRENVPEVAIPRASEALAALFAHQRHPWFFAQSPVGILEIRGAPIQPSATTDRDDPAHGWFLAARLWHDDRVAEIGAALGAEVTLLPTLETPSPLDAKDRLRVQRRLMDERNRLVGTLLVERLSPALGIRGSTDNNELTIFITFGAITLLVLSVALHRWVLKPLEAIERSLRDSDSHNLGKLITEPTEFGRLARLVDASSARKQQLAEEVSRRQEIAEALQQSESILRQTIDDRVRLGRDLHDSVIQTLYASGMGIASARKQIPQHPAEADQRLQTVQDRLNETIRELRLFITGLEPETAHLATFEQSIERLVKYTCEPNHLTATTTIDAQVTARLTPTQRAQLLQVIRETLSNTVRHADATTVRVELTQSDQVAVLSIEDNGRGLPHAEPAKLGRGLHNIRDRISSLDGELNISSAPGIGTRLDVTLPLQPSTTAP